MGEDLKRIIDDLSAIEKKVDQCNEQITLLRIAMATSKLEIKEAKRFQSSLWGVIGGAISAILIGLIDFIFKK